MRFSLLGQRFWPLYPVVALLVFLNGCGGGSSPEPQHQALALQQTTEGQLLDSAVEGLYYSTKNRSGFTRSQGKFIYEEGDQVTFMLSDPMQNQSGIILGTTHAGENLTPVDLIEGAADETDPGVTNMARLLLTLDQDGEPDNGITITLAMLQAASGLTIDWSQSVDSFASDPVVEHLLYEFNHTGYMVDCGVEGLTYESPSHSGLTDQDGAYKYEPGENITFRLGDIELGTIPVRRFTTPVNLVPGATDETDVAVTNMTRLLLTLDMDCNTANGITITDETRLTAMGRQIDWSIPLANFENDSEVQGLLNDLIDTLGSCPNRERQLVGVTDAQDHLHETLLGNFPEEERSLVSTAVAQAHLRATLDGIANSGGGGDGGGIGEDCRYLVPDANITVSLDPTDESQMTVLLVDHSIPQSCVALPDTGTATVFWGDGTFEEDVPIVVDETELAHQYQNPGTYSISYIFYDSSGRKNNTTDRITVANPGGTGGGSGGGGGGGGGGVTDCRYLLPTVAISVTQNDMTVTVQDQSRPQSCAASTTFGTANIFWGDGTKDEDLSIRVGVTQIYHTYFVPGGYTFGYTFYDTFGRKGYVTYHVTVP